jgi:uncharacterized protein involved in exopolysaccharide biosynthesis
MSAIPPKDRSTPSADSGLSLIDLALVLAGNIRLLIGGSLAVGIVALLLAFLISPTFTSTARLLPPTPQQSSSAALAAQLGALAGVVGSNVIKSPVDQYVALLKSRTVADALVERFKLRDRYGVKYTEDARRALAANTRISAGPKDGIISIEVDDHDPKKAAEIANAFVDELKKMTDTLAVTEAAQRRLFFERQLTQAKDSLAKAETALRASGVSEMVLKTMPQSALEGLARLKAQITAQEIKLSSMRILMTESNPEFKLALNELLALRTELARAEQANVGKAGGEGTEYFAKFRDFKYQETLFELMVKQFEMARLDEAREGTVIQVVDVAQPPEKKSKPKKAEIAVLTTFCAFLLLMIYVLARQALRNMAATDPDTAAKLDQLRAALRFRFRRS